MREEKKNAYLRDILRLDFPPLSFSLRVYNL